MKRNMKVWLDEQISLAPKKALPILSFPAISLMGISVRELISDSSLQARAMKLVADREDTAASVSFMDLSAEAECFGSKIIFSDSEVPTVTGSIIKNKADAEALKVPPVGTCRTKLYLETVKNAIELITDRPVLAGAIGPFSLAGRLMDVSEIMVYCYEEPETVHLVMDKVTSYIIEYCLEYKKSGANGILMAEPLTGLLSPVLAKEFSSPYVKRIIDAVQDDNFVVIYHNCGNNTLLMIDSILSTGAAAFHFGNAISMAEMMKKIPADTIAMGNISPAAVFKGGTPETVRIETLKVLEECKNYPNFIISSGCDIPPTTPWENIDAFFSAVSEFYGS